VELSLDDQWTIEAVIYRYAYAYDSLDADAFVAVFTPDGVFEAFMMGSDEPLSRTEGQAELRSGPAVVTHGIYHDRWCRLDGTWRIAYRRFYSAGYPPPPHEKPAT
jgi:hypothetical protein